MNQIGITFWIKTLPKICALSVDITFSHMVFMFTTNITVKMGSNAYRTPTLPSNLHNGSGLAPIKTSKNRPTKKSSSFSFIFSANKH